MQNPVLERHLSDCKELAQVWRKFLDLFNAAIRGGQALNPDNEQQFLECKSRIAMLHDSFMDSLKHDHQIGQNVFLIIARCITMRHVNKMSQAETKKIEIEWHESYLLLTETLTAVEEEIQRLAAINPTKYHLERFIGNLGANIKIALTSTVFKVIVGAVVIFFILYGIPAFGIYDYDNFRRMEGVNKVYFKWMNLKRSTISPSTPFGQLSDFESRYLPSNLAPSGFAYQPNDTSKDKIASTFARVDLGDGKNMKTELIGADEYKAWRLERISQSSSKVEVYAFHYYRNYDAQTIADGYNARYGKDAKLPFSVFATNNVLVILVCPEQVWRSNLATTAFAKNIQ